jgi:hypothetical protein
VRISLFIPCFVDQLPPQVIPDLGAQGPKELYLVRIG